MRVFVTGAGGFIGSHLVEGLLKAGHSVTGLAHYCGRDTFGWLDEVKGCTKLRGDIRDAEFMREVIAGHDVVYHLAALGSVPYGFQAPLSVWETNTLGTLHVAHACIANDVRLIFMSTSEVYGGEFGEDKALAEETMPYPTSIYAASKLAAEHALRAFLHTEDLDVTILRVFNTYGPRQSVRAVIPRIISLANSNDPVIQLGNNSSRSFLYVTDTVSALIHMLDFEGIGPFNVGTSSVVSMFDLAGLITTKPVNFTNGRPTSSEVWSLRADASRFCRLTGWEPKIPLIDGVFLTQDWFRQRGQFELRNLV